MKNILLVLVVLLNAVVLKAQEKGESRALGSFRKVIASPHISVVLVKGDKESISLLCNNIAPEKVNVRISGNKLLIYLDHARIVEKHRKTYEGGNSHKSGVYKNVSVTAYITYTQLSALEIRGAGELSCDSEIISKKLKVRAYGECMVKLASLQTHKFKVSLYGENDLTITSGTAARQVYRIFGESKVDTRGLESANADLRVYGEGRFKLNVTDEIHLTAFGEPRLTLTGHPMISHGIVIGHATVD